jgi:hypothetical protein
MLDMPAQVATETDCVGASQWFPVSEPKGQSPVVWTERISLLSWQDFLLSRIKSSESIECTKLSYNPYYK